MYIPRVVCIQKVWVDDVSRHYMEECLEALHYAAFILRLQFPPTFVSSSVQYYLASWGWANHVRNVSAERVEAGGGEGGWGRGAVGGPASVIFQYFALFIIISLTGALLISRIFIGQVWMNVDEETSFNLLFGITRKIYWCFYKFWKFICVRGDCKRVVPSFFMRQLWSRSHWTHGYMSWWYSIHANFKSNHSHWNINKDLHAFHISRSTTKGIASTLSYKQLR